jgi:hypothetical protein
MKRAARYASANCERTIVEEPRSPIPHQFSSSQVLVRFVFRLGLVSIFATFSPEGFGTVFAALLALWRCLCRTYDIGRDSLSNSYAQMSTLTARLICSARKVAEPKHWLPT